jgi:hypothetical protein
VELLNLPSVQGTHVEAWELPVAELTVPVAHCVHTLEPPNDA